MSQLVAAGASLSSGLGLAQRWVRLPSATITAQVLALRVLGGLFDRSDDASLAAAHAALLSTSPASINGALATFEAAHGWWALEALLLDGRAFWRAETLDALLDLVSARRHAVWEPYCTWHWACDAPVSGGAAVVVSAAGGEAATTSAVGDRTGNWREQVLHHAPLCSEPRRQQAVGQPQREREVVRLLRNGRLATLLADLVLDAATEPPAMPKDFAAGDTLQAADREALQARLMAVLADMVAGSSSNMAVWRRGSLQGAASRARHVVSQAVAAARAAGPFATVGGAQAHSVEDEAAAGPGVSAFLDLLIVATPCTTPFRRGNAPMRGPVLHALSLVLECWGRDAGRLASGSNVHQRQTQSHSNPVRNHGPLVVAEASAIMDFIVRHSGVAQPDTATGAAQSSTAATRPSAQVLQVLVAHFALSEQGAHDMGLFRSGGWLSAIALAGAPSASIRTSAMQLLALLLRHSAPKLTGNADGPLPTNCSSRPHPHSIVVLARLRSQVLPFRVASSRRDPHAAHVRPTAAHGHHARGNSPVAPPLASPDIHQPWPRRVGSRRFTMRLPCWPRPANSNHAPSRATNAACLAGYAGRCII